VITDAFTHDFVGQVLSPTMNTKLVTTRDGCHVLKIHVVVADETHLYSSSLFGRFGHNIGSYYMGVG